MVKTFAALKVIMNIEQFVDALEIRWRNNLALRGNRAAFFGGILESSPDCPYS